MGLARRENVYKCACLLAIFWVTVVWFALTEEDPTLTDIVESKIKVRHNISIYGLRMPMYGSNLTQYGK